jgi:hypothetical protein
LKAAKQQSIDLRETTTFFDSVLEQHKAAAADKKDPSTTEESKATSNGESNNPKAEDPEQKSERNGAPIAVPSLLRAETAKPELSGLKSGHSPVEIATLAEALAKTQQSLEAQTARVKSLEDLLLKERTARETAETRALQLEQASTLEPTKPTDQLTNGKHIKQEPLPTTPESADNKQKNTTSADAQNEKEVVETGANAKVHARLEQLVSEMEEMRKSVESWRKRAELAEEESASSRKTLAEMVEKIRRDEETRLAKLQARKGARAIDELTQEEEDLDDEDSSEITLSRASTLTQNGDFRRRAANGHQNGKAILPKSASDLDRALAQSSSALVTSLKGGQPIAATSFASASPYASVIGVIAIGLSVMALLNRYQKNDP